MELENYVERELLSHGYPIFYRNLKIHKNKHFVTEYDIVSYRFIIEVKSGHDLSTYNSQFKNQLQYLPKGYTLYCYCPALTNPQISEYNGTSDDILSKSIIFINNLEYVYNREKFEPIYNIRNQRDLTRLLTCPLHILKRIKHIAMKIETFYYTYLCINFINDYYNSLDNCKMFSSEKLNYLMDNNVIIIRNSLDTKTPYITTKTIKNKININGLSDKSFDKLNLNKWLSIYWCKSYAKSIDLNNQLPIVEGITKNCKCNKKCIFIKEGSCGECKRTNIYKLF